MEQEGKSVQAAGPGQTRDRTQLHGALNERVEAVRREAHLSLEHPNYSVQHAGSHVEIHS